MESTFWFHQLFNQYIVYVNAKQTCLLDISGVHLHLNPGPDQVWPAA